MPVHSHLSRTRLLEGLIDDRRLRRHSAISIHTGKILNFHMLRLQRLSQLVLQRIGSDSRCVGHGGVDGGVGARGEGECSGGNLRAEKIAAASAQDVQGGGAGEHQVWCEGGGKEGERERVPADPRLSRSMELGDLLITNSEPPVGCGWCVAGVCGSFVTFRIDLLQLQHLYEFSSHCSSILYNGWI